MSVTANYTATLGTREERFEVTLPVAAEYSGEWSEWKLETNYREVTITLAFGQFWPARLRKGVPITYEILGHRFVGVVKRKRRHVLVVGGEFES